MSDTTSTLWRPTLRQRLVVIAVLFLLWSAAIQARLVYLQVYRHDDYVARAENQQSRTVEIKAARGDIVDRNGRVLAWSVPADSVFFAPNEIDEEDRPKVLNALCGALESCDAQLRASLARRLKKNRGFEWVRRQVTPEEKRRIAALKIPSVNFIKETRRFYPNGGMLAHVLGYVGIDGNGLGGVELSYDRLINGTPGTALVQSDARHAVFSRTERPPVSGATVELTIDKGLQYILERELKAGVALNRAQGGTAIVMDPWSGEILAMASEPTFNPNDVSFTEPIALRNRAIEDTYEPGSTFKTVTASAALEEGVVKPEDWFDTTPGFIRIGNSRIVRDTHPNGSLTFMDGIIKSSNVLAIKVGFKIGGERLARYVRRFGFGQKLLADLKGESPGIVWREFNESALASVSMGYQVGVTALQMATAVSSVANGGRLMEPHLVRAIQAGGKRTVVEPKVLRETISAETAATLTAIMEGVVERGTAKAARIDGYTIAGKTGTAAKLVDGVYSKQKYNSSFVGFFPSRKPRYTIIVVIDSPSTGAYYGGAVAAPIFKKIAEAIVPLAGVAPSIGAQPTLLVKHEEESPVRPTARTNDDVLRVDSGAPDVLPDVRGLSAREALRRLIARGLRPHFSGDGIVVEQKPEAGTPLAEALDCHLKLARVAPEEPPAETEERP